MPQNTDIPMISRGQRVSGRIFLTSIFVLGMFNVAWSATAEDWRAGFLTYALLGGHALVFSLVAAVFLYTRFRTLIVFSLILFGPIICHGGFWFFSASSRLPEPWEVPWFFLTPALAALLYLGIIRFLLQLRMPLLELLGWSVLAAVSMSPLLGAEAMSDALGPGAWIGLHILVWYVIAAFAIHRMAGLPTGDDSLGNGTARPVSQGRGSNAGDPHSNVAI